MLLKQQCLQAAFSSFRSSPPPEKKAASVKLMTSALKDQNSPKLHHVSMVRLWNLTPKVTPCMKLLPVATLDLIGWFFAGQYSGSGHLLSRCPTRLQPRCYKWTNKFDFYWRRHLAVSTSEDSGSDLTLKDSLEQNPVSHLFHGTMTVERRASSGSGSSLTGEDFKRPFIIGVAGGTASGKVTRV